MTNASSWGALRARTEASAKEKYPNKPERQRRMVDTELGLYNGPYKLEPLSFWERVKLCLF